MTQDDINIAEQITGNGSLGSSADQAGGNQFGDVKAYASDLVSKVGKIQNELAHVSASLQEEAKTVASDALDLVKHPSHYAEFGASWLKAWLEKVWEK